MVDYELIKAAYAEGNLLVTADNGFIFKIRTNSGEPFEGIPPSTEAIEAPKTGFLTLEMGSDMAFIPFRSIESITVIAVG